MNVCFRKFETYSNKEEKKKEKAGHGGVSQLLGRLKQYNHEFEASLSGIARTCQEKKKEKYKCATLITSTHRVLLSYPGWS